MNRVEMYYKKVVVTVCQAIGTDPVMLLSSNKEINVDARGIVIAILTEHKYSDGTIAILTGMTRQAVNRIKNIYPDRIKRSYYLRSLFESVREELVGYEIRNCKHCMGKVPRNRSPTGNEDKCRPEQGNLA